MQYHYHQYVILVGNQERSTQHKCATEPCCCLNTCSQTDIRGKTRQVRVSWFLKITKIYHLGDLCVKPTFPTGAHCHQQVMTLGIWGRNNKGKEKILGTEKNTSFDLFSFSFFKNLFLDFIFLNIKERSCRSGLI